ncbi:MAG: hypothetical protein OXB84_06635 [Halobacteriovoraceae bacterium]|nr:hypothetical protein [Halobacteriovoraceae bacterium]
MAEDMIIREEMKQENKENKFSFFKFCQNEDFPIYIKVDLSQFGPQLVGFLSRNHFSQVPKEKISQIEKDVQKKKHTRILLLSLAPSAALRQSISYSQGDQFEQESIIPHERYQIYRYGKLALMLYSDNSREWRLGGLPQFGSFKDEKAYKIILNRYLGLSLLAMGIVGFWGSKTDGGMIVLNKKESSGDAVFVDVEHNKLIASNEVLPIPQNFEFIRLDRRLKGKNKKMTKEELYSFLSINCTYFDYGNKNIIIKQAIENIVYSYKGYVRMRDNLENTTDLSI